MLVEELVVVLLVLVDLVVLVEVDWVVEVEVVIPLGTYSTKAHIVEIWASLVSPVDILAPI